GEASERREQRPGLWRFELERVDHRERLFGQAGGEHRAQCQAPHLPRQCLLIRPRMGPENDAATFVVGRAPRALASVASALLAIGLLATAGDFTARAGVMGALARVCLLRHYRLMDNCLIRLNTKDAIVQIDAAQDFAVEVEYVGLHY